MTKLSPDGRPQPEFIHAYLKAREKVGLPAPQEIWDSRNGWVHYRDNYGVLVNLRKSYIERFTAHLEGR